MFNRITESMIRHLCADYKSVRTVAQCYETWQYLIVDCLEEYNNTLRQLTPAERKDLHVYCVNIQYFLDGWKKRIFSLPFPDICRDCDSSRLELATSYSEVPVSWLPGLGLLRGQLRGEAMRSLYRIVNFPRKIPCTSMTVKARCVQEWFDFESTHNWVHSPKYIPQLNRVMRRWLKNIDLTGLSPGHGPGTTSEGYDNLVDKYANWYITPNIRLLSHKFDLWVDESAEMRKAPTAKGVLVPKNWKSLRFINAEPMPHQWAQQALMKRLYAYICKHRYLKHRLPLTNQTRNQDYALQGSYCPGWATVDLSSASDSVSMSMVKEIFRGTKVLPYLVLSRTAYAQYDTLVVKLKKFAPMGNALSFPIESLIFAACCEVACAAASMPFEYSVYGDDIIIHYKCIPILFDILESLNFRVNKDKSFVDPGIPFRESCGKEYYAGVDVTPLYFRIEDYRCIASYDSIIELCNSAWFNGYSRVRKHLISQMPQKPHLWCNEEHPVPGALMTEGDISPMSRRNPKTGQVDWILRMRGTKVLSSETRLSAIRNAAISGQAVKDWLAKRANANQEIQLAVGQSWRRRQRRAHFSNGWWLLGLDFDE